ncbi:hypothetical protein [Lactiplantibacillus herbarum]|uniref:hypothetical protein n=1 Tax=Lactiplantibacillus herbarum TaxID=1670446 RepID=UPI000B2DF2B9|nr:hypothetical protein [Lactiplantibacillus herbarum]
MLSGEIIVSRRCVPIYDKARIGDSTVFVGASIDAHHVPAIGWAPRQAEIEYKY